MALTSALQVAGILGQGLSLASQAKSLFGGDNSSSGYAEANAGAAASAKAMMEHQINMYKHRHQWEVEDLRAAGLNPVLSAKFGGQPIGAGASYTPINKEKDVVSNRAMLANVAANTAKTISELSLNNEKAKTEQTLQARNRGTIKVPGIGEIPIEYAVQHLQGVSNAKKSHSLGGDLLSIGRYTTNSHPILKSIAKRYEWQ